MPTAPNMSLGRDGFLEAERCFRYQRTFRERVQHSFLMALILVACFGSDSFRGNRIPSALLN